MNTHNLYGQTICKHASKQASKQASEQASKQGNTQGNKQKTYLEVKPDEDAAALQLAVVLRVAHARALAVVNPPRLRLGLWGRALRRGVRVVEAREEERAARVAQLRPALRAPDEVGLFVVAVKGGDGVGGRGHGAAEDACGVWVGRDDDGDDDDDDDDGDDDGDDDDGDDDDER